MPGRAALPLRECSGTLTYGLCEEWRHICARTILSRHSPDGGGEAAREVRPACDRRGTVCMDKYTSLSEIDRNGRCHLSCRHGAKNVRDGRAVGADGPALEPTG